MPPKAKIQLSKAEKNLIDQWVLQGVPKTKLLLNWDCQLLILRLFFLLMKLVFILNPYWNLLYPDD